MSPEPLHYPHITRRLQWELLMEAIAALSLTYDGSTVQEINRAIAKDAWTRWREACEEMREGYADAA